MGKRRRNKLCWCGSGKPYKICHYKRGADSPILLNDLLSVQKKIWTKEYCLHPQRNSCNGNIIQAHTIQRRGSLERISKNGHVYTFKTDLAEILKTGMPKINLVGIKKASTFSGFCSHHDNELFKPVEEENFSINEETVFLLSYRVLCHELFLKRAWRESLLYAKENLDKGKTLRQQIEIQDIADGYLLGVESSLEELSAIKIRYDEALVKCDYKSVRYYAIILDDFPTFVCSGFTQPIYDFHGNQLQDLADLSTVSENLAFSVIATNTGGIVIYSWIDQNTSSKRLIKSLANLTYHKQLNASVRFTFENFENLYISPNWWEILDSQSQQNLFRRHLSGSPDYPHNPNRLIDDGVDLVTWKISKIETNISEEELLQAS
jgi:hypothetical protein